MCAGTDLLILCVGLHLTLNVSFVKLVMRLRNNGKYAHFHVNSPVREYASVLNDVRMVSKLSDSDLIAREAKYPSHSLVAYYDSACRVSLADCESTGNNSVQMVSSIASFLASM